MSRAFAGGRTYGDFRAQLRRERHGKLRDEDTFTLNDIVELQEEFDGLSRPFAHLCTFVPPGWRREPVCTAAEFNDKIGKQDSPSSLGLLGVQISGATVVAAGGYVQYLLRHAPGDRSVGLAHNVAEPGDVDYFLVKSGEEGFDPREALDEFVCEAGKYTNHPSVLARQRGLVEYHRSMNEHSTASTPVEGELALRVQVARGCITATYGDQPFVSDSAQLIARGPYETAGAVVSGFDLGASSVVCRRTAGRRRGVPRVEVLTTARGLYSAAFGVELLPDLETRSTSFRHRVAKAYVRGTGLTLPGIDPKWVQGQLDESPDGFDIPLLDFVVRVAGAAEQKKHAAGREVGMWTARIVLPYCDKEIRDYDPATSSRYNSELTLGSDFVRRFAGLEPPLWFRPAVSFEYFKGGERFDLRYSSNVDLLSSLVEIEQACKAPSRTLNERHVSLPRELQAFLGLTPAQASEFYGEVMEEAYRIARGDAAMGVVFNEALRPRLDQVRRAWVASKDEEFDFWDDMCPGRQWTASRNPTIVDQARWYQTAWAPGIQAAQAALPGPAVRKATPPPPDAPAKCSLCLTRLQKANRLVLVCGHEFCWTTSPECEGLAKWFSIGKTTCPICRRNTASTIDNPESAVMRESLDAALARCRALASVEREPYPWSALPPAAADLKQKMDAAGVPAEFKAIVSNSEALRELLGQPPGPCA